MQNSGTPQNTGRQAGKSPAIPPTEQMGTSDSQSEFSVNEARRKAAQEENAQRQQNADADKGQAQQSQQNGAGTSDPQSEFSVEQRREGQD